MLSNLPLADLTGYNKVVASMRNRSPQYIPIMEELTKKFGREHTKLINNCIIREINKSVGRRKAMLNVRFAFSKMVNSP